MNNNESARIVPGANTAVLLIHGICGTPNHFRQLLPLENAVPKEWSFYNIVLDGHCRDVEAFGNTSMKKWKYQVHKLFDELCNIYENVVLVGHSMGTLFSIELARKCPEKVPFMFLIAVPICVAVRPVAICYALRIAFDRLDHTNPVMIAMRISCGMTTSKKLWKYISWTPRMIELLRLCRETRKTISELRVPAIAWQSVHDELVSQRTGKLLRRSGAFSVNDLRHSTHFYYTPEDRQIVVDSFCRACKMYIK